MTALPLFLIELLFVINVSSWMNVKSFVEFNWSVFYPLQVKDSSIKAMVYVYDIILWHNQKNGLSLFINSEYELI